MPPRSREQKALFQALGAELRFALQCGMGWDDAIQCLNDQVERLKRLRDHGAEPTNSQPS